jgi:LacI family transcriptional regulator
MNEKDNALANIKEIAEAIGVSHTTITNVIHGRTQRVSAATIETVQGALEAYNYIPNMNARGLVRSRSKIVGVIIMYVRGDRERVLADPFNGELVGAIGEYISQAGFYMMFQAVTGLSEIENLSTRWNVDGLILASIHPAEFSRIRGRINKPTVYIDRYHLSDEEGLYCIMLDDRKSCYEMTNYLIEMGHKKILFLANDRQGVDRERYIGFTDALNENNLPLSEDDTFLLLGEKDDNFYRGLESLYQKINDYTALFFSSDLNAVRAMNYLIGKGIKIPEDISIVGYDDNILARYSNPRLTTVHQDVSEKGRCAVDMLVKLIKNEPVDAPSVHLRARLVLGDSVKSLK